MKDFKFFVLLIKEFLKRYTWRTFSGSSKAPDKSKFLHFKKYLGIIALVIIVFLVFWNVSLKYFNTPFLSEGIIGTYSENSLPQAVTNLISEPLVKLDKSGQPEPNLVSGWQVNNNSTLYTFRLKDNLYWNDGIKLKASDIKFDLPEVEVSYPNDQTIEFKLADSFAPFPTFLSSPILKENSLVGIGKYQVTYKELSQSAVVKLILTPKNKTENLPIISIRFYPDEKTAKTAFELGEIDAILGVLESGDLKNQPSVKEERVASFNKLVAVFYNTKDPLLSSKDLRKALSYSAPEIEGEEKAVTSIPSSSWGYNKEAREYLNNPEAAKGYLEKVKLDGGKTVTLTTTPALSNLGEKIIQAWKQAGIEAVLRVESGIPQNFQALLISQTIPVDPDQYTLWHSTQTKTNFAKYSFARVDKDLEDGRKTSDQKIRKEKYFDFQKVLLEDAPATFLYFPKMNVIYRGKIGENLYKILPYQIHN